LAQEAPKGLTSVYAPTVDEILTRLEKRSDGLKDIQAKVTFVDDDQVNLSKGEKNGTIRFWITEPNPHFMIHFQRTVFDGAVGKNEWYLFDGEWLYQAMERTKSVAKQQMAPPGEKLDLFDIEKTPFPLPFGQKKDKILKTFDVSILGPGEKDPPNTDHLMLVPKPGSRVFKKYDRIDMYVDREVHLPRRIVVLKNQGMETSTADFPDLSNGSINTGVSKADFGVPAAWKGYTETVEELVPKE
jgi:hypothetical protein